MNTDRYLVAVDAPLPGPLSYLAPETGASLMRGQSVRVPLGKRTVAGVVLGSTEPAETEFKLKPIADAAEDRPLIPQAYMDWLEWLSQYYLHPLGQVVETVFPPLTNKKGRGSRKSKIVKDHETPSTAPRLTEEQQKVIGSIESKTDFAVHLLHGVTGSGKTEVYLQLLSRVLASGGRALVLVPEISLTPQLIDRFSRRFPGTVAVLHSHLTDREKTDQWWSVVDGQKQILIGARSALFCPIPSLQLIILDEEHETSYKQDEKLKYHARDAAIVLAKKLDIPILLGSATPSLETWHNALAGRYRLHSMKERVESRPLPTIEVVDLREVHRQRKSEASELPFWLSDRLHQEMTDTLVRGEQAALFLNRRGLAQSAQCHACGYVAECPNCSVTMTVHDRSYLVCHYCDYSEKLPGKCPDCHEAELAAIGLGTERVQKDLQDLFPTTSICRADRDEIQSREQLETLISDFEQERTQVLIGTQMIAKGLDFPKLNLVGLVLADVGFHWPDFRASERSFQLLTQMSGRAGRETPGRVIIQTYDPTHPSLQFALSTDYQGFADYELSERKMLLYPPFGRLALIRLQAQREDIGRHLGDLIRHRAETLQEQFPVYQPNLALLGPAPAPLFKLRNKYRFQMIIKCDTSSRLNAFCRQLIGDGHWQPKGTKVQVDIDPHQMM
ncbi:MAG: primosomal protein N' [Bdellovibrionales bacterium]